MAVASEDILGSIAVGDHLCCICHNAEAGLALAIPFLKAGLDRNERCVYVVHDTPTAAVIAGLTDAGADAESLMDAGQISILRSEEAYLAGGGFDPQRMLDLLNTLAARAQEDGYKAMRGVGEMTWALRGGAGAERLAEYEAKLTDLLLRIPYTALCVYNRGEFPDEMLLDVIKTHPVVMLHDQPLRNVEYVPPDEYLDEASPECKVQRALRRIQTAPGARRGDRRILGASPQMRRMLELISRVAPTDSSVLITGETGTGKELVAQALHDGSPRRTGAFVKVNCAAVPADLLEVELFGHERGAFTDAHEQRPGRFELADGGTLMLDEIGEMLPQMQVKLLRVLQEREFERVGGTEPITVDIRVLALTNQDLLRPGRRPTFRRDLYYRLNVIHIEIPPLRERPEDIPVLAKAFLARTRERIARRIEDIDADAMEVLLRYDWPGNVRELENAIERAVVLAHGTRLSASDFAFLDTNGRPAALASLEELEARHIARVLRVVGGNRTKAADVLGIHRDTLYRKLRQYGISGA